MADPRMGVPGLDGWLARIQENRGLEDRQIQQVGQFQTLQKHFADMAEEEATRRDRAALGPSPSPEALLQWGMRRAPAKDTLHYLQQAETARNQQAITREAALARLQQAASQFEANFQLRLRQATSKEEQDSINNQFKLKKQQIDAEGLRIAGRRLHWETGDEGFGVVKPLETVPTPAPVLGAQLSRADLPASDIAAADTAFAGGSATVDRQMSLEEQARLRIQPPVAAPPAAAPQPAPAPVPQPAPAATFPPEMPEHLKNPPPGLSPQQVAAARAKWLSEWNGQKAQNLFATDTALYNELNAAYDRMQQQAALVKQANLGRITGPLLGFFPETNWPGSEGSIATSRLRGLKDQVMVDTLRTLKGLSPTGAAGFGSLTEEEGRRLENYLGNIQKATNEKELRRVVGDIEQFAKDAKKRLDQAYKLKHGTRIGAPGVRARAEEDQLLRDADAIINRGRQ